MGASAIALLAVSQAELARSAVDPLTAWVPPAVLCIAMIIFALLWWRASNRRQLEREQAEDKRYDAVATALVELTKSLAEIRLAMSGFVTVERHTASVSALHEKFNEHGRQLAVLLDRRKRVAIAEEP